MSDEPAAAGDGTHRSGASVSFGENTYSDAPDRVESPEADDTRPTRAVTVWWHGGNAKSSPPALYASHNGFSAGVEMEGSAEKGWSAEVRAPIGADLLYRFAVDGEWVTQADAPILTLNGDEFNCMRVEDEDAVAADGSPAKAKASSSSSNDSPPPRVHRRQSSKLVWDRQRSTLLIADEATAAADAAQHATPSGNAAGEGLNVDTSRFSDVHVDAPGAVSASPLSSPRSGGDDEDDSGDEDGAEASEAGDATDAATAAASRTKRKNARHRAKLKERAMLTPQRGGGGQYSASGFAVQAQSPSVNHAAMMQIHQLRMQLQEQQNEFKQTWLVHEMRSFQQREAERAALKAQMADERTRLLAKLKEYTTEVKQLRDENLALKTAEAQSASKAKLEKSTARRSEKFQTLQKNVLNEEMMIWITEKNRLQGEIDAGQSAKAELQSQVESLRQALQTSASQLTNLGITLQARESDLETAAKEKAALVAQLAASASNSSGEAASLKAELAAVQAKASEEARAATQARSDAQMQAALVATLQADVARKTEEAEAAKREFAQRAQSSEAAAESLKSEVASLQNKLLKANESLFQRQTELEQAQLDKEAAEQAQQSLEATTAVRVAAFEKSLAEARSASSESADKILALNSTVREMRQAVSSLGEFQRQQASMVAKEMAQDQSFIVDALQVQSTLLRSTMAKMKKEMSERRKLHNTIQELKGNIRVYCRTRPLSAEEKAAGGSAVAVIPADEAGEVATELTLDQGKKSGPTSYEFDACFGPESTQAEVFTQIVSLVTSVLDGYSCCLFAYGQTGAGKTHTMSGTKDQPGMNLRSLTELFRLRDERKEDVDYEISVSFYEVYNENLYDLLDTKDKELKIRQGATGVFVEGLESRRVTTEADVLAIMAEGNSNRTVASTSMNAGSSRSHSILSVHVHGHNTVLGMQLRGTLHLIDLAGSERIGRSNVTGIQLKEAQAINLSLSALGNCIEALQKKQAHVPFRNSKLTHILSQSLGGHSKTLMMVNVSPAVADADETACSLQFATRVRATELGTASKNVSSAPSSAHADGAASTSSTSAAPAASASALASPPPKRAATSATGSAVKKPAAAATGSAVKKPLAPGSAVKKPLAK